MKASAFSVTSVISTPHWPGYVLLSPNLELQLYSRSWRVGSSLKDCRHFRDTQGFGSALLPAWWLGSFRESRFIPRTPEAVSVLESSMVSQYSLATWRNWCFLGSSRLFSTISAPLRKLTLWSAHGRVVNFSCSDSVAWGFGSWTRT